MSEAPFNPPDSGTADRLRGMNPSSVAGVLRAVPTAPSIPGWQVKRPLGEGGLGMVWEAVRESDSLHGAVKVPRAEDITLIERLEAESAALAALDHPGIVRLLESGALADGSHYLVMECIDGTTLADAIPAEGFPAARALELFGEIAGAVAHAHSRGVLHRDLKPGNVILDQAGKPHVADFGLAHPVHERVLRLALTVTGMVAGTAEYLPPEACRSGYRPAVSMDIYALGIILHELLTGSPPRGAWPPVSERKADVDIRIDDLLRRALDPDPAARFASVEAMLGELRVIRASPPRYSGTPRCTPAVRAADFAWTLLGMLICAWAVTIEVLLIDEGPTGQRLRAWFTLTGLLLLTIPAGTWQLFRLWRFRRVLMREALPAPFGIRLGPGRLAAVLVAAGQLVCVLLPAFTFHRIYRDACAQWLRPDSPPWEEGLAVTIGYRGLTVFDPWEWPKIPGEYCLRERAGWPADGLGRDIEHSTFYPGYAPRLMLAGAVFHGGVIGLTLLSAVWRWWRFRRPASAAAVLGGAALAFCVERGEARLSHYANHVVHDPVDARNWQADRRVQAAVDLCSFLHNGRVPEWETLTPEQGELFAAMVDTGNGARVPREDHLRNLARMAAESRTHGRTLQHIRESRHQAPDYSSFSIECLFADTTDHSGGLTLLLLKGDLDISRGITITRHQYVAHPLWTTEPRVLDAAEGEAWAAAFFASLSSPAGKPDPLDPLVYSELLAPGAGFGPGAEPAILPWSRDRRSVFSGRIWPADRISVLPNRRANPVRPRAAPAA